MAKVLTRLEKVEPKVDHGHHRYGAYTTQALHLVLQKRGKQLRFLNKRIRGFKCKTLRAQLVVDCTQPSLLIIGRRPRQVPGTWHCIARAKVGDDYVFIDADDLFFMPNKKGLLGGVFEFIDGVYAIEDIVSRRVKPKKLK
ncbi:hypothetical protein Pcac1_g2089 [Phytophthora cactorum]|nr:hypothetical protein Pcac1_g2089 [Phytophthora cactorum]KAG2995293.1 hypothetical protein PC119_g18101 [Phytophthora cactorum]KAG4063787.1 hypothetical protein PC123_g1404 [Phytophthora cactorum]